MMRMIPTQVHGVLDYLTGGTLLSAPKVLGLNDVPASARVLRLAGGGAILYSLLTDYELGAVKLLPMPAHLAMDAASGVLLASSPWVFGFAKEGPRYWLPHVAVGTTEMLAAATTKTG
ncbi:MAG: hypothetical protein M3316_09645 [Actinomycetota bacterium]|jgi:hypothetical protein|nr:hypothetical protein [Actinomycetota bacterium]